MVEKPTVRHFQRQCFQYNKYLFYTMEYKAMNHLVCEVQNQEKVMNLDSYTLYLKLLPCLFTFTAGTSSWVSFIFSRITFFSLKHTRDF